MAQPLPEPIELPGLPPLEPELSERLRGSCEALPPSALARAHHRDEAGRPRFLNRLVGSSSPYLLQHAFNPVGWFPWGEEAFETARATSRPILLSVGYATCHWCHVMERESFEDLEIAARLNARFVPVKVDREQRPDVDAVYMMATQLVSGGGGWPMTVALTPEGEPFFAGTYFPARDGDRGARVGFLTLLERLSEAWEKDRERVAHEASRLTRALQGANRPAPPEGAPGDAVLHEAARFLARTFDPEHGGFGSAPKFPRPSTYELLLRYHRRSRDPVALHVVVHSLEKMCRGGIHDQLAGGFARYSTDREWLVPHFEKMLYDNAQLASLLVDAWRLTSSNELERALRRTLDYVIREMTAPEGGFFSATDADSEGVEGKYFIWTRDEIIEQLGETRGGRFAEIFGVREPGFFEGASILHLERPLEQIAAERGLPTEDFLAEIDADREILRRAREARVPPLLDDKILTEWNAQMMGALARAAFALDEPRYLDAATAAAEHVVRALRDPTGRLHRSVREGRREGTAVLEDYAFFADALLDLFEATGAVRWIELAISTAEYMIEHFADPEGGGLFATADDAERLILRDKPCYDGAQPSGNSVAALAFLRLEALTTEARFGAHADRILKAFGGLLEKGATANPKLAGALDWRLDRAKQIVVVTAPDDPGAELLVVLRRSYCPNSVRVVGDSAAIEAIASLAPWVADKRAIEGRATAYVCISGACKLPTQDPAELAAQLRPEVPLEAPPLVTKSPSR